MSKEYDLTENELEFIKTYNELSEDKKKEFIQFLSELSGPKLPCVVRPASRLGKVQAAL